MSSARGVRRVETRVEARLEAAVRTDRTGSRDGLSSNGMFR
jgi:hypothetical protein